MHNNKKNTIIIMILLLLLCIAMFLSLLFGSIALHPVDILKCLIGQDSNSMTALLIYNVRIPRMLASVLAGMGLACAGVILQGVMNNALASPNTIGVNSGAGFAVMLCLMLFGNGSSYLPFFAFGGALITTILIFALAYLSDSSRTTIILAGITVSTFLNAGMNTIKLLNSDVTLNITTFTIGTLSGVTMKNLIIPGSGIVFAVIVSFFFAKHLNILNLGDEIARSLGVNVSVTRCIFLILSSVMAGCVVSFAGLLSFIGLIVPHIARRLFGNDARLLLPCSALLGSLFVLVCDLLGRTLAAPYELPAGIVMSFVGGPFFLYLLLKKKGGRRVNA